MPALSDHLARATLQARFFRSRRVRTSVGRMFLLEGAGTGKLPPLVLLHGLSSTGVHYFPLVWHLRPHVRKLILPDLPGHGFSEAPLGGIRHETLEKGIAEVLDEVLNEPAVLFGNSLGALAAIRYANMRPDRVRGLFLCSPGGAPMPEEELGRFLDTFKLDSHASAVAFIDRVFGRKNSFSDNWGLLSAVRSVTPNPLRHVLAWEARKRMRHPNVRHLLAAASEESLLSPNDLSALRMPLHVSWGQRDGVLPAEHLHFFRKHLPSHAVLNEPKEHGHSPYLEDAPGVGRAIVDFLTEVDRAQLTTGARPAVGPGRPSPSSA